MPIMADPLFRAIEVWRTYDDDGRYAFVLGDDLVPLAEGDEIHEASRTDLWSRAARPANHHTTTGKAPRCANIAGFFTVYR